VFARAEVDDALREAPLKPFQGDADVEICEDGSNGVLPDVLARGVAGWAMAPALRSRPR